MVDLPWRVQLSVLSTFYSKSPIAPTINGFNNSGTSGATQGYTPLLGILGKGYSDFLTKKELESLVAEYNATFAGTPTPHARAGIAPAQRYPVITLPTGDYQLGDIFSSQDVRIAKSFRVTGETDIRLIAEAFNIFNVSNVTNFSYNLTVPAAFGQANQRVGQTFGSGGPRAFQVAARVSF
jgi:hypothetical protein